MARKRAKLFVNYECTLTGERFKRGRKVTNTDDLVSVAGYYQLNPDKDDRPEFIKRQLEAEAEEKKRMEDLLGLEGESKEGANEEKSTN